MRKFALIALTATLSFPIEPVVSTQWLAKHLHKKDLVILDLSQRQRPYPRSHQRNDFTVIFR